jgi:phage terminase large subunit GpA-like protein
MTMQFERLGSLAIRPPEKLSPSQWAEKHRRLAKGQSSIPGPWRNANAPYLTALMDLAAIPGVSVLTICKPAQVGVSEACRNIIAWLAATDPDPCGLALPDERKGRKILSNRVLPMFRTTPTLKALFTPRSHDLTKDQIMLLNGFILHLMWAGSAASMSADPMRVGICDEVDKYVTWSGSQADPVSLVQVRLRQYKERGLLIIVSTPTTRLGVVWTRFERSTIQLFYFTPCPLCSKPVHFTFDNMKFERGPSQDKREQAAYIRLNQSVWLECPECKGRIGQEHKAAMAAAGRYRCLNGQQIRDAAGATHESLETVKSFPAGTRVGIKVSPFFCQWMGWEDVAAQFVEAHGDLAATFSFRTDTLGDPFDQQVTRSTADVYSLKCRRATLPEGTVPKWAFKLLASIDTQHDHFWVVVRAWGPGKESGDMRSHRVWHGRVESFEELDRIIFHTPWRNEDPNLPPMFVELAGIDSGGTKLESEGTSRTVQVYKWAFPRRGRVRILKGDSRPQVGQVLRPGRGFLDTGRRGRWDRAIKEQIRIWLIATHHFADELAGLIVKGKDDPAEEVWSLNQRDDPEYNAHLSNVVKVIVRKGAQLAEEWVPASPGARIDLFDCEIYQIALAYMAQVHLLPSADSLRHGRGRTKTLAEMAQENEPEQERSPWRGWRLPGYREIRL